VEEGLRSGRAATVGATFATNNVVWANDDGLNDVSSSSIASTRTTKLPLFAGVNVNVEVDCPN